jgi:glucose-1-phosphate thymidylyltransferase
VVKLDGDRIVAFEEKPQRPKSSLVATACWLLPSRILPVVGEFAQTGRKDNMGDFIAYLVGKEEVRACVFTEAWLDIGSAEVYYGTR